MDRAFDQAFGSEPAWSNTGTRPQFWLPVIDAYETEQACVTTPMMGDRVKRSAAFVQ